MTPQGCCVPFGVMDLAVASLNPQQRSQFDELLAQSEVAGPAELEQVCEQLQVRRCGHVMSDIDGVVLLGQKMAVRCFDWCSLLCCLPKQVTVVLTPVRAKETYFHHRTLL